jgi:hypothetical protein
MNNYKSEFPYLVDISVGDSCPFNCEFCYTSSSNKGTYADGYFLSNTLKEMLLNANVFNVVFGGGEPTLFAGEYGYNLSNILTAYKGSNFVTGVTTRNYNLHKHPQFIEMMNHTDSLAISCTTLEDLAKAALLRAAINESSLINRPKIYVQTILGLTSWEDFQLFMIQAASIWFSGITLLGYKSFGFGEQVKPYDIPDDWIPFVKNLNKNIGVDSIIVSKYRDKLIEHGVNNYYLVGSEGKSSCYVDALKRVVKPSSFTDIEYPMPKHLKYQREHEWFLETFAKF